MFVFLCYYSVFISNRQYRQCKFNNRVQFIMPFFYLFNIRFLFRYSTLIEMLEVFDVFKIKNVDNYDT